MKKDWLVVGICVLGLFWFWRRQHSKTDVAAIATVSRESVPRAEKLAAKTAMTLPSAAIQPVLVPVPPRRRVELPKNPQNAQRKDAASYVMDEGLLIIQGDLVVGAPTDPNAEERGYVAMPTVDLWPSNVIPYFIQPNVKNPERVLEALQMFQGTGVQFVPYTDQADALVFEDSTGICKSYVGRIGGKQPIWIPLGCEATEVAHEVMHALGFVHEQNRADRDQFIEVKEDAIKEEFKNNFDLLPASMMKLSGLDQFDFESIMMYPPTMFAKSSAPTMVPKNPRQEIRPGFVLSEKDKARIRRAFNR
jgi:hypothetical protein